MSHTTLVLLGAGSASRFRSTVKKQWLYSEDIPLWLQVAECFSKAAVFEKIIVVSSEEELQHMKHFATYTYVPGGNSRQESLQNALLHVKTPYVMVSDIARACIDTDLLERIIHQKGEADCIVPYLSVSDTIVYESNTIDRDQVKRIQTPQLSRTTSLQNALKSKTVFTDESSAIAANGGSRLFIEGNDDAHKITFLGDLLKLPCIQPPSTQTLVGNGFDVHAFEENKPMVLAGVAIESNFGFRAHSDGDVAIHALIDALLGAAGMGDIGMLFPDNDTTYKNIDSTILLQNVVTKLHNFGYVINNVDITIAAETPRLSTYKTAMRQRLSEILQIDRARVNVKATTTEKLGFIGRKEGAAVMASASLNYYNWTNDK